MYTDNVSCTTCCLEAMWILFEAFRGAKDNKGVNPDNVKWFTLYVDSITR
jgi:hypothetical protein